MTAFILKVVGVAAGLRRRRQRGDSGKAVGIKTNPTKNDPPRKVIVVALPWSQGIWRSCRGGGNTMTFGQTTNKQYPFQQGGKSQTRGALPNSSVWRLFWVNKRPVHAKYP